MSCLPLPCRGGPVSILSLRGVASEREASRARACRVPGRGFALCIVFAAVRCVTSHVLYVCTPLLLPWGPVRGMCRRRPVCSFRPCAGKLPPTCLWGAYRRPVRDGQEGAPMTSPLFLPMFPDPPVRTGGTVARQSERSFQPCAGNLPPLCVREKRSHRSVRDGQWADGSAPFFLRLFS